ncbi:MAG TPA: dihydrolipoamide acetyltransferase family protein [Candidatus Sulfotelmatobacter sp.]|jgi:pyruvate dehydrogenase E2 component (dihydrolipoamide acetyltransferase)|nr:dihydrolipoamide acetyltransferase family protein [Candidatus Sulfotelmatobacter sp.]
MAFSVVMPALEMAQETGKLIAWRKQEGDRVSKGEPLLEIETDKAVVEVEAPADGILAGIKASAGADIPVGQTIAWIVAPGEAPPAESAPAAPAARAGLHPKTEQPSPVAATVSPAPASTAKISPKARRLAKELGVDIATVHGSGPGGEILASDVQATAATPAVPPAEKKSGTIEVPSSLGRIMAERTTQSWTTVPHFFVTRDIDAGALDEYRERVVSEIENTHQVRITHTDLLVVLVARVLLKHPRLNASWTTEGIRLHDHVNMGVAIAVSDGVVAAVIPNAHTANVVEIALRRRDVAERARAGKLRPADIADATFTISNLGMYQVDQFSAIITAPQAAILAVGGIADRVVAIEGKPAVRPIMTLTVSCDHRVADGAKAALFLSDLAEALRAPSKFLT